MPEICKSNYINIHRTDALYFIHINVLFLTKISIFSTLFIYAPESVLFSESGSDAASRNIITLRNR